MKSLFNVMLLVHCILFAPKKILFFTFVQNFTQNKWGWLILDSILRPIDLLKLFFFDLLMSQGPNMKVDSTNISC